MSTFTDTSVRISLATPEDIRDLSQKSLHLWVGATSPLWAPFWAAASFGVGAWALGQGAAKVLGGTLYDKDLPLALKWPGFAVLPKHVEALSPIVEKVTDEVATTAEQAVDATAAVATEAVETVAETVETVAAAQTETASKVEAVAEIPVPEVPVADIPVAEIPVVATKAVETAAEATDAVVTKTAKTSAVLAKRAAEATLDLLGNGATAKPGGDTRPLIDPVTEAPVIPAVVEAVAEPKPPLAKPAPRRPRKG